MQSRPVPPLLHRITTRSYRFGGLDLQAGERIVLAVGGATQEILASGQSDVMMVFGGKRGETDAPTHACPGSHLAMGALLGLLTAILERRPLAPTPALLTVRVRPPAN